MKNSILRDILHIIVFIIAVLICTPILLYVKIMEYRHKRLKERYCGSREMADFMDKVFDINKHIR